MTSTEAGTPAPRPGGVDLVAASARRLVDAIISAGPAVDAQADRFAAAVDVLTAQIRALSPDRDDRMSQMWTGGERPRHDPVSGSENPVAPPLVLRRQADGSVLGRTALGMPYQGPKSLVHGGISALLLDQALAMANSLAGMPALTVRLDVRFVRPVPLHTELVVSARQSQVRDRKITGTGEIRSAGDVLVTAEALSIAQRPSEHNPFHRLGPPSAD